MKPPENLPRMSDIEIERHWQGFNANPNQFRTLWKDGGVWRRVHRDIAKNENLEGVAVYNMLTGERIR